MSAQWYEMIERGEKTEEYREIKRHWSSQIMSCYNSVDWCDSCGCYDNRGDCSAMYDPANFVHFDAVRFSYGYTRRTMTFEVESITIGRGRPEWGAPDCDVFIIKLGKRL